MTSVAKKTLSVYAPGSADSTSARSRHSETAAECLFVDAGCDCSSAAVVADEASAAAERRAHTSSLLQLPIVRGEGTRGRRQRARESRCAKHRGASSFPSLFFYFSFEAKKKSEGVVWSEEESSLRV